MTHSPSSAQSEREVIDLLKRARYVRHEDLPADVREEAETRAAYGNSSAWADARDSEQRRLINEAIAILEARAAASAQATVPYRTASDCPYVDSTEEVKCAWADGWNQCAQYTKGSHDGY